MRKYLIIYEGAVSHALAPSQNFPFFFNSVRSHLVIVMFDRNSIPCNEYGGGFFDL